MLGRRLCVRFLDRPGDVVETSEFVSVLHGERSKNASTRRSQPQPHHAPVLVIDPPRDETGHRGAVNEPDGAVVAKSEVVRDVSDGRAAPVGMAAHRDQQFVLDRGDAGGDRRVVAVAEENA